MAERFHRLKTNIRKELEFLVKLKTEKDSQVLTTAHPRILASILHDFYTGIERIFLRIAKEIDGKVPGGKDWHKALLVEMTKDLEKLRPPLITIEFSDKLEEYLRFRHLFRNVYGFVIEKERMKPLLEGFDDILEAVGKSVREFEKFIDELADKVI